jgi:hypothetical protein
MFTFLAGIGFANASDVVPGGDSGVHILYIVYPGPPCATWWPVPPLYIGNGFYTGYCQNRTVAGYQVQRDTFYYYNGDHSRPVVQRPIVLLKCYSDPMHPGVEPHFCP